MIYFLPFRKKGKKVSSLFEEAPLYITFVISYFRVFACPVEYFFYLFNWGDNRFPSKMLNNNKSDYCFLQTKSGLSFLTYFR
jgi:hypothetical protein